MCFSKDDDQSTSLLRRTIESADFFARPLPQFKLKGKARIPSLFGGIVALLILAVMTWYGLVKASTLLNQENPNVSSFLDKFALQSYESLSLPLNNLRFAWAIERSIDGVLLNDPRYIKYIMRMRGRRGNEDFEKILDYHECTSEELDQFPEPSTDSFEII